MGGGNRAVSGESRASQANPRQETRETIKQMNILCIFVVLAIAAPAFSQATKPVTVKPKAAAPAAKTKTATPAAKSKTATAKTPAMAATQPKSDAKPVLTIGEEKIT